MLKYAENISNIKNNTYAPWQHSDLFHIQGRFLKIARIRDEVVERLKQEVSVERPALARCEAEAAWRRPGLCPGVCQRGGTVIDRVMRAEGVSQ